MRQSGEVDPVQALHAFVDQFDTKGDAASALAISQAFLSQMLHGDRKPSPRVLAKLGLKRTVVQK